MRASSPSSIFSRHAILKSDLISVPSMEELLLLDCLLYKVQREHSDPVCRAVLEAMQMLHICESALPVSMGFRFSEFWSEDGLSPYNISFSPAEQLFAIVSE
jgi:hypothetical protein